MPIGSGLCILLKSNEGALPTSLPPIAMTNTSSIRLILIRLFGEEKPRDMWILFGVLVLALHLWLFVWGSQPVEKVIEAKPLEMAVEMITLAKPLPVMAPPKPVTPPPQKKPQPKKPPVTPKPVTHKPPPEIQQKAPDYAPVQEYKPEPTPVATNTASSAQSTDSAPTKAVVTESYSEAKYNAGYLHNPKPEYPALARSRGWTGKVKVRVHVTANGEASSVSLEQSSGHDILDEAALEAIKEWRFEPAKRGDTPVASVVIVPMPFNLTQ